ncbi:hypothetical protein [endosymbiont GvMRE of Glomus versiforme]|uniref:hypothetical protein n=1 Tax=endosymbiont GvMRE of Glomus versiforme TaxID=2039283 RepID=UPI000EEFDAD4|nr:hypothetical protein [endosymbiont GvMRE of Glomus versiforme]RHZ35228.1 hypothetical protein GvMRE_IIg470 [endosymbiont GvMRE of Glomus versiforme]
MTEVEQEIQKKKQGRWTKKLTLSWELLGGSIGFCLLFGYLAQDNKSWWVAFIIFTVPAIWSLLSITSESGKVKNLERKIERLERKKKELRNSIR